MPKRHKSLVVCGKLQSSAGILVARERQVGCETLGSACLGDCVAGGFLSETGDVEPASSRSREYQSVRGLAQPDM